MIRVFSLAVVSCSLFGFAGCGRSKPELRPAASTPVPVAIESGPLVSDACVLLSAAELESALGEKLQETKPTGSAQGRMAGAQCYFNMATPANSVGLAVFQKSAGGQDPREFWEETFHHEGGDDEHEKGEREEKKSKPQAIAGLGDESFWAGTPFGGALYVLKGNMFLRLTVGGARDQAAKLKLSRELAELALKRL